MISRVIRFLISHLWRFYKIRKNTSNYWREQGAKIGERCEIHPSANFGSEPYLIEIGSHVRVNMGVHFVTHDGGVWVFRKNVYPRDETITLFGRIKIGDNVHIGTNVIIMPGVTIGNNCVIGCGAIVTHDVPDNSVAAGVPTRIIESIDEYYTKNHEHFDHTKMMSPEELRNFLLNKYP